ncbi:hypothetical protein D6D05_03836 [Aureobasidium pullulans]|nr:hypothetical protein D6D05_03836 [Aureobasidium pullulans]
MRLSIIVASLLPLAFASVIPEVETVELDARGDSGCYPFQAPNCCINYAVCQCKDGKAYQFNQDQGGCQPPWGFLANSVTQLPGYCC